MTQRRVAAALAPPWETIRQQVRSRLLGHSERFCVPVPPKDPTDAPFHADDLPVLDGAPVMLMPSLSPVTSVHGAGNPDLDGSLRDLSEPLRDLAVLAASVVPGNDGIGVTVFDEDGVPVFESSNGFAKAVDRCQYRLGEGPCVDAVDQARTVVTGQIGAGEHRWPQFAQDARNTQVRSVLSVPLIMADHVIGSVNIYSRDRDAFATDAIAVAEQFAGPAAAALATTQLLLTTLDTADFASYALVDRARVETAVGVLMAQQQLGAEDAHRRLLTTASASGVTVTAAAAQVLAAAAAPTVRP